MKKEKSGRVIGSQFQKTPDTNSQALSLWKFHKWHLVDILAKQTGLTALRSKNKIDRGKVTTSKTLS